MQKIDTFHDVLVDVKSAAMLLFKLGANRYGLGLSNVCHLMMNSIVYAQNHILGYPIGVTVRNDNFFTCKPLILQQEFAYLHGHKLDFFSTFLNILIKLCTSPLRPNCLVHEKKYHGENLATSEGAWRSQRPLGRPKFFVLSTCIH